MRSFHDSTGQRYSLVLTLGRLWEFRAETGFDIFSFPWQAKFPARLIAFLIRDQVGAVSNTEELARRFPKRVRRAAARALREAIIEFFPPAGGGGTAGVPADTWQSLWQLGGRLGIDIRPLTPRQLLWMAQGARTERRQYLAELCALIANCHRSGHQAPFRPEDFLPAVPRTIDAGTLADLLRQHAKSGAKSGATNNSTNNHTNKSDSAGGREKTYNERQYRADL